MWNKLQQRDVFTKTCIAHLAHLYVNTEMTSTDWNYLHRPTLKYIKFFCYHFIYNTSTKSKENFLLLSKLLRVLYDSNALILRMLVSNGRQSPSNGTSACVQFKKMLYFISSMILLIYNCERASVNLSARTVGKFLDYSYHNYITMVINFKEICYCYEIRVVNIKD